MKKLLAQLDEICTKYKFREKVVVVPTHSAGHQLLQAYANAGYKSINLKTTTIGKLAEEICSPILAKQRLSIISNSLGMNLIREILEDLGQSGRLEYFNGLETAPGICRAISGSIMELEMAGFTSADIRAEAFGNPGKGQDIKTIFNAYERLLDSKGYIDRAGLFRLALQQKVTSKAILFILPSNLKLSTLEEKLLHTLAGESEVIHFTSVFGLPYPSHYISGGNLKENGTEITTNQARIGFLYDIAKSPPPFNDSSVEMFHAYGESNEVMEVLRRIKNQDVPIDNNAVFYSKRETYVQLFYNLAQKMELPMTFGEGFSIKNTHPGRLYFALLEWINGNFDCSMLHSILTSGNLRIPDDDAPSEYKTARILRDSGIGWGRQRYIEMLDRKIEEITSCLERNEEEGRKEFFVSLHYHTNWAKEFVKKVFASLPDTDSENKVNLVELASGLAQLVNELSYVAGETDMEAKAAILAELNVFIENPGQEILLNDALGLLTKNIEVIRIGGSGPKPGYLHIDSFRKGIWVNRPYNYIAGLDAHRFPAHGAENPVLLDMERERIGGCLILNRERARENLFEMVQLMASVPGKITVSYSCYDTVQNRGMFPATILLQLHRLLSGDAARDYSHLAEALGRRIGFMPDAAPDSSDENEWWLNRALSGKGIKKFPETVLVCFENLQNGLRAWDGREEKRFTEFDGKVNIDSKVEDPRQNNSLTLSCSRLETLAKCPFSYFLQYVLGIRPPEDVVFEPGKWLDPATRGTLIHAIFEKFYRNLKSANEKPQLSKHEQMLYEIAGEMLETQKQELPPPSQVVYDYEAREILGSCRLFLATEEEVCQGVTPCFFELSFGIGDENDDIGLIKPVAIEMPDGSRFYLRGKIDRVDQVGEDTFEALDYKTGSTYSYSEREHFKGGRQLQHALYAIVLEEILKDKGIHTAPLARGGYVFPTLKGEGQRFMRTREKRNEVFDVLECLFNLIARGTFVMTEENGDCTFCDYVPVCERGLWEDAIQLKMAELSNAELEDFRRLRTHV